MGKQTFKYLGICISSYLLVAVLEIFLLPDLIDFISTDFWIHLFVYVALFIIVNPTIVKIVVNKFNFEYQEQDFITN